MINPCRRAIAAYRRIRVAWLERELAAVTHDIAVTCEEIADYELAGFRLTADGLRPYLRMRNDEAASLRNCINSLKEKTK